MNKEPLFVIFKDVPKEFFYELVGMVTIIGAEDYSAIPYGCLDNLTIDERAKIFKYEYQMVST